MRRLGALGACVAFAIAGACGSEDAGEKKATPTCDENPWEVCGAGETCWPVNASGQLQCQNAPTDGIQGVDCALVVGEVACAPHLYCFVTDQVAQTGVCRAFCNKQLCPDGGECIEVPVFAGQKTVFVCAPESKDSGVGGTGGSDAASGGSAGSTGGTAGTSSGGTAGTSSGGASGSAGSGG